jgi:hypothetical protein
MLAHAAVLIAALAGDPGQAAQAPGEAQPRGGASPSATPRASPGPGRSEAEDRRIGFDVVLYPRHGATLVTIPYQGPDRTPLVGASFYEALGRPDLVAEYRARSARRSWLIGVGAAVALGGALYTAASWPSGGNDPGSPTFVEQMNRDSQRAQDAIVTGAAISAGGLVLMMIGAFTDPNPVDEVEARRLADEYNRRLEGKLGALGTSSGAGTRPERPRVAFGAAPAPGGAMAALAVTF